MPGLLLEPPGAHVRGRTATPVLNALRIAASAGAAVLALTSNGDVVLLAVVLGLAALDGPAAAAALLALAAAAVRGGSTSLTALAGVQHVIGAAGWTGGALQVASAWVAALALASASPRGLPSIAFGAAAGLVVAGPAAATPSSLAVRLVAAAIGTGAAHGLACVTPSRAGIASARRIAPVVLAGAALALASIA